MAPASIRAVLALAALLALAGCSEKRAGESAYGGAAAAAKAAADEDSAFLAYEHDVAVQLPEDEVLARAEAVQQACHEGRFGACSVLGAQQQGGEYRSASLTVRILPDGVEPMIGLASAGGTVGSRSTRAEDLAVVVRDNAVAQDRLRRELERLREFQQRQDLSVADMIALSERIAAAEAEQEAAEREGAQHRRRIDTELLTLRFEPPRGERGRSEIGEAIRDFGATLALGTAWTIRALAFLIPLGMAAFVVVWAVLRLRRRRRRG
ncbi:DUF4349 domain-containing protein [Luteimonas sp. Y-2-2-4F]|nr:DUF4349 domain-containing protein [Luteimonas sp. Y-2-2-4F]MCD9033902.1 DUF4349 domain-containing protein [Luteimonas sp. Y-2-2-4F]